VSIADIPDSGFRTSSLFGDDAILATVSKSGVVELLNLRAIVFVAGKHACRRGNSDHDDRLDVAGGFEQRAIARRWFVGMLTKIAIAANGSVQLVSHPSLTGINSDSGLSGTTQWHNSQIGA
jgi:hypothetical protein